MMTLQVDDTMCKTRCMPKEQQLYVNGGDSQTTE